MTRYVTRGLGRSTCVAHHTVVERKVERAGRPHRTGDRNRPAARGDKETERLYKIARNVALGFPVSAIKQQPAALQKVRWIQTPMPSV